MTGTIVLQIFSASSPFTAADIATWRAALSADGYLHLRDLLPRATVIAARHRVTDELERRGLIHPQPRPLADGMPSGSEAYHSALAVDPSASPNLLSDVSLHRDPVIVSVLEHARLVDLFELLLVSCSPTDAPTSPSSAQSIQVWTSEFKWLRAVPRGQCTGFHLDKVYMKGMRKTARIAPRTNDRDHCPSESLDAPLDAPLSCHSLHPSPPPSSGSTPLYSLWLPLGDVTSSDGTLVVSPGSHRNDQFASLRAEYGESSVGAAGNGTTSGWIDVAAHTTTSVEWHSSPCYAGSVVILDLSVLHGTTINRSDSYRLSCDTRWTCTTHTRSDEALSPLASTPTPRASIRFKPLP